MVSEAFATKPLKKKVSVSLPLRPLVNCGSYFKKLWVHPHKKAKTSLLKKKSHCKIVQEQKTSNI